MKVFILCDETSDGIKKKNGIYKKNFASALFCFIRYSGSVFIYRSSGSFFFIVFTFLMEMLK